MRIDPKDFALAVVSGNSSLGDSPEDISKNAIQLYLSALSEAETFNAKGKTEPLPKAKVSENPGWLY